VLAAISVAGAGGDVLTIDEWGHVSSSAGGVFPPSLAFVFSAAGTIAPTPVTPEVTELPPTVFVYSEAAFSAAGGGSGPVALNGIYHSQVVPDWSFTTTTSADASGPGDPTVCLPFVGDFMIVIAPGSSASEWNNLATEYPDIYGGAGGGAGVLFTADGSGRPPGAVPCIAAVRVSWFTRPLMEVAPAAG